MRLLSDLLLNYKIPRICAEEVLTLTGCSLQSNQVHYKNEKLTLSVPPVLKSALLLRQKELIQRIKARNITIRSIT